MSLFNSYRNSSPDDGIFEEISSQNGRNKASADTWEVWYCLQSLHDNRTLNAVRSGRVTRDDRTLFWLNCIHFHLNISIINPILPLYRIPGHSSLWDICPLRLRYHRIQLRRQRYPPKWNGLSPFLTPAHYVTNAKTVDGHFSRW